MKKAIILAAIVSVAAGSILAAGAAGPSTQPTTKASPQPASATSTQPGTLPSSQPANELILDLGNKVTMKLARIPAGKFMMGSPKDENGRWDSEGPQHEVTISRPFYMGVYTVTQEQYAQIMGSNPSKSKDAAKPVEYVTWRDATTFCKKLSARTGRTVRLPTEAEWEYACRAGSKTRYSFGDDEKQLDDYAWYAKNSDDKTHAVGQKRANAWGLYDMHGNVSQWCADWYVGSYADASNTDPTGPVSGEDRVLRGGTWVVEANLCRSAFRRWREARSAGDHIGFRVCVEVSTQPTTDVSSQSATQPSTQAVNEICINIDNKVALKLVLIPAGKFTMGSPEDEICRMADEGPQHEVTISKPLYMGVYAVTQEQYQQVMGQNPSTFKGAQDPVEMVSWDDAAEFCKKLSQRSGKTVRLPTEAEWEYACRADSATRFCFGDDIDDESVGDYAWSVANSNGTTHPVGQKRANAWGLYDMHGNVEQWCADWWAKYTVENQTNPSGPVSGRNRILRGGSWYQGGADCRSACRNAYPPQERFQWVGFRVVVDLK